LLENARVLALFKLTGGGFHGFISQTQSENRNMPLNYLGKVLFPRLQPWQQKKQARTVVWVALFSIFFVAIVVVIMFFENSQR
jgi:hypothetical protein